MKFVKFIQKTLASLFFLGYLPLMPGTFGSAAVVGGLWYIRYRTHFTATPLMWWVAMFLLTALSIVVSSRPQEVFKADDPKQVVIDECAGQFITFFLIPLSFNVLILGFLLFRFYDIVKPYPIYKMEELEGGVGITMDDVAAGVFANLSLMVIVAGYHMVKRALL
jgi:phosphatidylglycerophosphatase A